MTHEERIKYCRLRRPTSPDAKVVKWLENHIDSTSLIRLFLRSGDPNDFRYPNDYVHLYQPYKYYSIRENEDDLCFAGNTVFNYSEIKDKHKEQISKLVNYGDWEYDFNFFPSLNDEEESQLQVIRDRIILEEISGLISYYDDLEGCKGYLDMTISLPYDVEASISKYREILISKFEEKYPDVFLRLSFYVGWDGCFSCSFKFVYRSIFIEVDSETSQLREYIYEELGITEDEEEDEEDTQIFLPPTTNLDGHGKQAQEWDVLSDDAETDEYLKEIINQFSDSPLYNDAFTSKELIEFTECSNGFIGVSEVHAYNADDALSEALDIIIQDNRDVVEDVSDIRFIIYIGSNFEEKENLLSTAKYAIKKRLRKEFDNDVDIKVAIAHSNNLSGGGDLLLYALS